MTAFIQGENIALHKLAPDRLHSLMMAEWLTDNEVTQLLFAGLLPTSQKAVREEWRASIQNPNEIAFIIYSGPLGYVTEKEFIGTAGLYTINWIARTADFRIFIGDKGRWGQGIGTKVTRLVLDYAFNKLNLQMVGLGVNTENKAAVRVYEKAGFVHEGTLRRVQYRNGRYYDVYRMSILQEEFGNA